MTALLAQPESEPRHSPQPPLDPARLSAAKRAFTTRNVVPLHTADATGWSLLAGTGVYPQAGDLVLARVTELGQHGRLERPDGRRAILYPGDEVVLAYGARYAPDQFEGVVPADLGPCALLAAGGVAGTYLAKSNAVAAPTQLAPCGLLMYEGRTVSLRDWTLPRSRDGRRPVAARRPTVVGVAGTSMNAGKTTAMAALVRGLTGAGVRVGAVKATGTGAGGDLWQYHDAGAEYVCDFTDAGHPTTYLLGAAETERSVVALVDDVADTGVDVVLVEVADGICHQESAELLASEVFGGLVDGIVFAAYDSLGATAGVDWLNRQGYRVIAVSGAFTASPLARREAYRSLGSLVTGCDELRDPARAATLVPARPREAL